MAHTVDLRSKAYNDILRNAAWMARHISPQSAARWHAAIDAALQTLANDPGRCPQADEATELGIDLRVLMSGRRPHVFRILFTLDAATVTVHRVRHAAQDRLTDDDI